MNKKSASILAAVIMLAAVAIAAYIVLRPRKAAAPVAGNPPVGAQQGSASSSDEQAVRDLVTRFATTFPSVDLSSANAAQEIQASYAPFVSADILAIWKKDPQQAPGRSGPNVTALHFTILLVEKDTDGAYIVQARLTQDAAQDDLAMKLRKQSGGTWLITGFVKQVPI